MHESLEDFFVARRSHRIDQISLEYMILYIAGTIEKGGPFGRPGPEKSYRCAIARTALAKAPELCAEAQQVALSFPTPAFACELVAVCDIKMLSFEGTPRALRCESDKGQGVATIWRLKPNSIVPTNHAGGAIPSEEEALTVSYQEAVRGLVSGWLPLIYLSGNPAAA
ncbi:MAG: hypothetical protein VCD00_00975 [Candidatus Hydrogenedentota bacterium]